MDQIQVTATFPSISDLDQFKRLLEPAFDLAGDEPGTVQYDGFFSQDGTEAVFRETYVDSDAVLAHLKNVGHLLGPLGEAGGGVELEIFGNPSTDLEAALSGMSPKIRRFHKGK